jgi:hypothetical protein
MMHQQMFSDPHDAQLRSNSYSRQTLPDRCHDLPMQFASLGDCLAERAGEGKWL